MHYEIRVRICQDEMFFGVGIAQLMELIREKGSLSEACRTMGMAYSKGWRILKRAETNLGYPLIEGTRGGHDGGNTKLTKEGSRFLASYRGFEKEMDKRAEEIYDTYFPKIEIRKGEKAE